MKRNTTEEEEIEEKIAHGEEKTVGRFIGRNNGERARKRDFFG